MTNTPIGATARPWSSPPRPDWVDIFNREGALLDLKSVIPLDPASLIDRARSNTGLDDFREDGWRERFEKFVTSLDAEAQLTAIGRLITRSELLMFLEARLRVQDMYERHPEINDIEITAPLWIVGQGRSGTSLLQTLLSLDPAHRSPRCWEAMLPVPLHEGDEAARRSIADARLTQWNRVTPEMLSVHEFNAEAVTETIQFEAMSFRGTAWLNILGLTPGFNTWVATQPYEPSFEYAKRVFKLLEWQTPGRRWVLKSPDSLVHLPEVMKVFPDARIVWAHRDPIKSMSSAISLVGTLVWLRSDLRLARGAYDHYLDPNLLAGTLNRAIDWIEAGVLPGKQLCNVLYDALIREPIPAIASVYEHFGLDFSDGAKRAMLEYLDANPRSSRPAHKYNEPDNDKRKSERMALERYQAYFNVPNEA